MDLDIRGLINDRYPVCLATLSVLSDRFREDTAPQNITGLIEFDKAVSRHFATRAAENSRKTDASERNRTV